MCSTFIATDGVAIVRRETPRFPVCSILLEQVYPPLNTSIKLTQLPCELEGKPPKIYFFYRFNQKGGREEEETTKRLLNVTIFNYYIMTTKIPKENILFIKI